MTYLGLSMWNGSSKIHYFMDFWHSFCWRPWRPWMLLSTKFKGHKSNFRISGMYRFCFYDLKVHFWWPNKSSKHQVLSVNTLYIYLQSKYVYSTLLPWENHRSLWSNPRFNFCVGFLQKWARKRISHLMCFLDKIQIQVLCLHFFYKTTNKR